MSAPKKAKKETGKSAENIYQFKIVLNEIKPAIWRRFQVKSDITLLRLHEIIQMVMGWSNSHLHQFRIKGYCYLPPDPDWDPSPTDRDDAKTKMADVINNIGQKFIYEYDFGDSWEHTLTLEKIEPAQQEKYYPVCIEGKQACPPEDCGGPFGYEEFLKALADPKHEEHELYTEWIGGKFDSELFELEWANEVLEHNLIIKLYED